MDLFLFMSERYIERERERERELKVGKNIRKLTKLSLQTTKEEERTNYQLRSRAISLRAVANYRRCTLNLKEDKSKYKLKSISSITISVQIFNIA